MIASAKLKNIAKLKTDSYFKSLFIILLLYVLSASALLIFYRYQLNPDGISYITIAQKYACGDFTNAINGLWSPMYSWMLVPFIRCNIDPQISLRLLNFLIGIVGIVFIYKLARSMELGLLSINMLLLCSVSTILVHAGIHLNPDLLAAVLLLIYFYFFLGTHYLSSLKQAILCGFLGALAYLSKSYMLPFFLGHFIIINTIRFFSSKKIEHKRSIVVMLVCGIITILAISTPWILLLINKYDKFTISTAGEFNMGLVSPGFEGRPQFINGFFTPPNSTAVSVMEDPVNLGMPQWSPFESLESFKYHLKNNVEKNIRSLIRIFNKFTPFNFTVILASMLLVLHPLKSLASRDKTALLLLISFLFYPVGFIFVHVALIRYFIIMYLLFILLGGYAVDRILKTDFLSRGGVILICCAFMIPILYSTTKYIRYYDADYYNSIHKQADLTKQHIKDNANIASDHEYIKTLFMSYYTNAHYYGIPKKHISLEELQQDLKKFEIDYYFVWGNSEHLQLSPVLKKIETPYLEDFEIYRVMKR